MSEITVKQMAEVLRVPVETLLEQLKDAGIDITNADASISNDDKRKLLDYLRSSHGKEKKNLSPRKKVVLKRKTTSTLKVSSGSGARSKTKTVNIEIKKRKRITEPQPIDDEIERDRQEAIRILEETRRKREEEERLRREAEEAARKKAEEEARQKAEEEARKKAEEEARKKQTGSQDEAARREAELAAERERLEEERRKEEEAQQKMLEEQKRMAKAKEAKAAAKKNKGKKAAPKTRFGRKQLHVDASRRREAMHDLRSDKHAFAKPTAPVIKTVAVPAEGISVGDLAKAMAVKSAEVIKTLMQMGMMATINQILDQETAILVVEEMGHNAVEAKEETIEEQLKEEVLQASDDAESRAPVVTIMGHVDHGKTSLLDYIRHSKIAAGEAGGITQHIGAYHVKTDNGNITFLDTPGHAAFTAMRARGAQVTDVAVIVVAANDGVMPQTIEAIQHAKAAGVPIIVAVNKIDLEDADPDRVKQELSKHEVIPEDWGGDTIFVPVSAKTGQGVDDLLEAISLQAEIMELKAVKDAPAVGVVVESSLDKGRGPVATLLVKSGTLHKGDMVLCGEQFGRARRLLNELGDEVKEAGPSIPVQMLGLSGVPQAGDEFLVVKNESKAREAANERREKARQERLRRQQAAKLENLMAQMGKEEKLVVNLLIKADVQGSVEALRDALTKLSNDDVDVRVISSGVGGITNADAQLALASDAIIIGFNVRADAVAREVIKQNDIDLHYFSIIYEAIDRVKEAITGILGTETQENIIGLAEVKEVFRSSKFGAVAGCIVTEGVIRRESPIRVLRDDVVIFEGELQSLRRHKDDVKEVVAGTECGIGVKGYDNIKKGDQIECYERVEVQRTLD